MSSESRSESSAASPGDKSLDVATERLRSPTAALALTDGVFAIIVTILVLEIAVPPNLTRDTACKACSASSAPPSSRG